MFDSRSGSLCRNEWHLTKSINMGPDQRPRPLHWVDRPCVPIPILPYYLVCQKNIQYVTVWCMWNAVCQRYQNVLLHLVGFSSMQASMLFWPFWPTVLCAAENTSHTSCCVAQIWTKLRQMTDDRQKRRSNMTRHLSVSAVQVLLLLCTINILIYKCCTKSSE